MLAGALVVVLLVGTLAWLRRKGLVRSAGSGLRLRRPRRLEHVDRLALTAQHSLHLVRMGNRAVLLGRSPSGLALLDSSEWHGDDAEAAP